MKIIKTNNEEIIENSIKEFNNLCNIDSPFIIKFKKLIIDKFNESIYLIME